MYSRYNYNGLAGSSQLAILSDITSILSGQVTVANLTGKIIRSAAAVGITNASTTVTWTGANDGADGVDAGRKTLEVGQGVSGDGVPVGATVATITNGTGFTLSAAATVTNAAAILILDDTATLPAYTIGATSSAMSTASSITQTVTGHCLAQYLAVGMKVSSSRLPSGQAILTMPNANTFTTAAAALSTGAGATFVFTPATALCDTTNSFILNTYAAAGWTMHDSYAAVGKVVMKAPIADDATAFKYMMLDVTVAGYLYMFIYEAWNNVSHTGTGQATSITQAPQNTQQRLTSSVSASMSIAASARFCMMQSNTAAGIGASQINEWMGNFERSRRSPWDTPANGYTPVVQLSGACIGMLAGATNNVTFASVSYTLRLKSPAGGDTNMVVSPVVMEGFAMQPTATNPNVTTWGYVADKVPDGFGGLNTPFTDILIKSYASAFLGGSISEMCDVWSSVTYPANFDEVLKGATQYIFWQNSNIANSIKIAIPKG